jgi:RND family efflux transporter MFP subunit
MEEADKTKVDLSSLRIHRDDDESMGAGRSLRVVLLGTLVVVLVGALIIGYRVWSAATLPEVDVVRCTVESGNAGVEVLTATGYVVAHRKAAVSPKISGRLEYLAVDTGSYVRENQLIGRLEHHDLDAQLADARGALANLQATKVQLEAELEQARASLAQAQANAEKSRLELERQTSLVQKGVTTRSGYDAALAQARVDEAQVRSAEALIRSTQAKINSAAAQIVSAQARIQGIEVQLEYTNVRAPFDGLVISKDAEVGENVVPAIFGGASARGSIVTIIDPKTLEVEADINESSIGKITMGLPAEITLDAIPGEKLPGETYQVVPTADRQKATVKVKVRFTKPDDRVLPDMNAKIAFIQKPEGNGEQIVAARVTVPKSAVQERDGRKVVFVLSGDRVTQQTVTLGSESGDRVEVKQGLAGGEQVVARGADGLTNGSRVKLAQR